MFLQLSWWQLRNFSKLIYVVYALILIPHLVKSHTISANSSRYVGKGVQIYAPTADSSVKLERDRIKN
ncbi:MAG: hypothetical protein V7K15_03690 [Nostoc sp.]